MKFDGKTYDPALDEKRLTKQLGRVWQTVRNYDGWLTLYEIARLTGDPESSISARLRDLRKERFGAYIIERRRRGKGLWEYRMKAPEPQRDLLSWIDDRTIVGEATGT